MPPIQSKQEYLEKAADRLLRQAGQSGKKAAAELIAQSIAEKFERESQSKGVRLIPPSPATVRDWFYNKCPDWAIPFL